MEIWIDILFKAFWAACAAFGFGVLFHVPRRNLGVLWIGGAIVGFVKFAVISFISPSIILASFFAALIMGIYCVIVAHIRHEPPMTLAIPPVIPLVPGLFAYRTMLGLMKLSGEVGPGFSRTLSETVQNGVSTLFIIMAFTIGIVIPYQIGKDISKNIY